MKKSLGWALALFVLVGAGIIADFANYPYQGKIWRSSQIERAEVNHHPVPPTRFAELLHDLRQGSDSKCQTTVDLWLKDGEYLMVWMDPGLARKYEGSCG